MLVFGDSPRLKKCSEYKDNNYMLHSSLPLIPTPPQSTPSQFAIMDSGATSNFFTTDAAVVNIKTTHEPLHVRIPNGTCLHSSHTCELDIPQLPKEARKGHIIPGMQGHSLVSLVQLCKAGCQVQIDSNGLYIWYRGFVILEGQKCPRTGLWLIPLTKIKGSSVATIEDDQQ